MKQPKATGCERPTKEEDSQANAVIGRDAVASVHAEGEGSVCCSVAHSGDEQGQEVCGLRSHEHLEDQIQQRIGNGGGDSDGDEVAIEALPTDERRWCRFWSRISQWQMRRTPWAEFCR